MRGTPRQIRIFGITVMARWRAIVIKWIVRSRTNREAEVSHRSGELA